MTKLKARLLASVSMVALLTIPAYASSSGSFAGVSLDHNCVINSSTGAITHSSFPIEVGKISFKVSAGAGTFLEITPSAVVGLFTDNKITTTVSTSKANVGVQVEVFVTPPAGTAIGTTGLQLAPAVSAACVETPPASSAASCVTYDQRFIEVKSSTLSALATSTTAFELIESTLSAHAFNFYMNVPVTGTYTIDVDATLVAHNETSGSVAACFGPATVTVTQMKNFSPNKGQILF